MSKCILQWDVTQRIWVTTNSNSRSGSIHLDRWGEARFPFLMRCHFDIGEHNISIGRLLWLMLDDIPCRWWRRQLSSHNSISLAKYNDKTHSTHYSLADNHFKLYLSAFCLIFSQGSEHTLSEPFSLVLYWKPIRALFSSYAHSLILTPTLPSNWLIQIVSPVTDKNVVCDLFMICNPSRYAINSICDLDSLSTSEFMSIAELPQTHHPK